MSVRLASNSQMCLPLPSRCGVATRLTAESSLGTHLPGPGSYFVSQSWHSLDFPLRWVGWAHLPQANSRGDRPQKTLFVLPWSSVNKDISFAVSLLPLRPKRAAVAFRNVLIMGEKKNGCAQYPIEENSTSSLIPRRFPLVSMAPQALCVQHCAASKLPCHPSLPC